MKIKFSILLLILSFKSSANYIDYYNQINEGEYQMYQGNYELAVANYLIAFDLVDKPHARDLYYTAKCYAQLQDDDNFYSFLNLSFQNGLKPNRIKTDSLWFTMYWTEPEFKSITTQEPINNSLKIDSNYLHKLQSLWNSFNQFTYDMEDSVKANYDSTSNEYKSYFNAKIKNNKEIESGFVDLSLNYELPNLIEDSYVSFKPYNMRPSQVFKRLHFMYLRKNSDHYNDIQTKLFNALKTGKITPLQYATIIDWSLKLSGEQIMYGISLNSISKKNFDSIIENRTKIGLSRYYATAPAYAKYYLSEDVTYNFLSE